MTLFEDKMLTHNVRSSLSLFFIFKVDLQKPVISVQICIIIIQSTNTDKNNYNNWKNSKIIIDPCS